MKNIFSKTTEKRTQNGLITDSKRTNYGISILLFAFLTLGFGQMWGAGQYNLNWQGKVYFRVPDNWNVSTYNHIQVGCARTTSTTTGTYQCFFGEMTNISHTHLYYKSISVDHSFWGQNEYIFFTANSSNYGDGTFTVNTSHYYTTPLDYGPNNSRNYYLFNPETEGNGPAVSGSWNSTRNNLFKLSNTIAVKVKKAGSDSYVTPSSATEMPATSISVTAYYLNGDNSSTSNTVSLSGTTYSTSFYGCPGGEITLSQTPKSGYQFDGYYVSSSSISSPYYPTSGSAITIEARYTEIASTVTLTASPSGKGSFTIGGAAATSTTAGVTTTRSVTAVPISGYHFVSWSITGGASISSTTTNPTTVTGGGAGTAATLTATFEADAVNSLTVSKGTGISSVTGSTSPVTLGSKYAISATVATGYTFSSWTASPAANGTFDNASSASTNVTVKNGSVVVTASASERMSALSTSCHYDVGNPSYANPTVSGSATTVGYVTTRTITATAAGTGYTFAGWTLTNCTRTDGGAPTATSITIRSNGDGAAASVVANYNEDLTTTWYIAGDGNGTGTDLTPGSPFAGWGTSGTRMSKKSGHSTEEVYYCTITVSTVATTDDHFPFKVYNSTGSQYYGNNGYWVTKENNHPTLSSTSGSNMKFRPYVTGTYEFKLDNTGANPVLTVTWPVFNQVRISAASPNDATNTGNFDMSDPVSNVRTVTRSLKANTTYTFKIMYNSDWYGYNSGTFTRNSSTSSNSRTLSTSGGNLTLTTDYAGDYTFRFNQSTKALSVDFPTAYKVTYGKGTVNGSSSSCSAKDIDNSNAAVTSNSTWVKSGNRVVLTAPVAKTGYTYNGWFDNNSGTGAAITTNANCTITVTSALTRYACYTINNHAITHSASTHGSYTIQVGSAAAVSTNTTSDYGKTIKLAATPATGYHFGSWSAYKTGTPATTVTVTSNQFTMPDYAVTVGATFSPNTYRVHFHRNGGAGVTVYQNFTYDVAQNLTANSYTRTGYTFAGWATSTSGEVVYANGANVSNLTAENGVDFHLYAKWTPNPYTVVLDKQTSAEGYGGSEGTVANQTVTFDATPAAVSGTMPTAKNGWAFMGFYSAEDGGGRRFIDPSGNWVTSAGDTISGGHWVKPEGITLYAYYKKAEITNLTFDAAVVAPGTEVGVTPTVAPTPEGTNSICWKLLYNNGNLYDPQPNFGNPRDIANKVTFTAPGTSGMYLVAAVLRTGNDCNGGTKLDSVTYPFQVAGDHTVTVQYKCGSEVIAPSTTVTGKPLEWTEVVAHDIFGYYFSGWTAGDGVTIEEAASGRLAELQAKDASIVAVIKMKAIYDGKLTANYSKRDYIYFKSTALGWNDVYVYFYTDGGYWAEDKGAGATGAACIGKGQMSLVPGETDIYYWDYSGITGGAAAATKHVAFTNKNKMDQANFWDCEVVYPTKGNNEGFSTGTPMFVPISQTKVTYNSRADYYNKGYWTKYAGGTGYSVDIFFSKGGSYDKSIWFEEGETAGMPFTATAYLSGSTTLGFKIHRSSGLYYYSSTDVTMSNASTAKSLTYDDTSAKQTGITTNVTGEYTFTLTCGSDGKLNVTVKYPAAAGDYRLVYSDGVQTKPLVSDVVPQVNGGKDTVSFFVRPENEPVLKIQRASVSAGVLSWSDYSDISLSVSGLEEIGVYNICLQMDGSGAISVENVEAYTGEFYIRTDAANNKWDNYRAPDHLMTYSEYSKDHSDYTHYFVKFVSEGTNVKFVVANDYSPCISDTLIRQTYRGGDSDHVDEFGFLNSDLPGDGANVRYMWDIRNNAVYRAYLAPAQSDGSKFLVLRGTDDDNLKDENGNALRNASNSGQAGYNHKAPDHCIQFVDDENWIYEATVQVVPSSYVKLYAFFHDDYFYYKGTEDDTFEDSHAIKLVEGSGDAVKVRVIYDFKTDRLVAAYLPSGDINEELAIHADVMFIREHQGDIDQLTFSEKDSKMGSITNIETAYAVMRFNKWTLNDKDKNTHEVLDNPKSIYERSLYYVSFPFPVNLNEVFGFGTYGQHWIIQRYRGDLRAQQGYWAESAGFWEFIWNRNGEVLQPNQGYILTLETELLGEESDVWGPDSRSSQIELFFPSTGNLGSITSSSITQTLPEHTCTINRHVTEGLPDTGDPRTSYNRTVFDSHWNIMSVPTYINVNNPSFANTTWISDGTTNVGPKFLYTWNPDDNTLTATSGKGFMYHAMHAYTVQYYGNVTWTTSVTPSAAPQRNTEYRGEYEFCLEVQQDEQMIDRTFVRLSDDENVTTGFEFGEDMTKQFNSRKANIFTIADNTSLGGNSLPLSTTQTTVVPVGVSVKNAGDYTFAIPEGTEGIGVTLVDNETGVRTSLSALSYTVTLQPGDYTGRFVLEISPIQNTPTGLEEPTSNSSLKGRAQKRIIDGVLYIVRDGKIFDARGARVE